MESCIYCNSRHIKKKLGVFAPFLVERMFSNNAPETSIVICNNCGFAYSEYRPNDEEMGRLYNGYRGEEYQKQRQKHEPGYTEEFNQKLGYDKNGQNYRKTRLINILKKYININSIQTVLDYGGDAGQFIPEEFKLAKKYVYEISNVESISGVEQIKTRDALLASGYDFIMCAHVLEHVAYPMDIIKEMYNLLNDNGYLYIELPVDYYDSWDEELTYIHEHISRYNIKTLVALSKIFKEVTVLDLADDGSLLSILIKKKKPNILHSFVTFLKILEIKKNKYINFLKIYMHKLKLLYLAY